MFSEWQTYSVVDPVLQSLEDDDYNVGEGEDGGGGVDGISGMLRYPVEDAFPLSRPLPVARVGISGELVPSRFMPLQGMF
jgi:hypothetical protein